MPGEVIAYPTELSRFEAVPSPYYFWMAATPLIICCYYLSICASSSSSFSTPSILIYIYSANRSLSYSDLMPCLSANSHARRNGSSPSRIMIFACSPFAFPISTVIVRISRLWSPPSPPTLYWCLPFESLLPCELVKGLRVVLGWYCWV